MGGPVIRAFGAMSDRGGDLGYFPVRAHADPILVFPGMEIHQGPHLCTLGYVDPGCGWRSAPATATADGPVLDRGKQDHRERSHV